jgi:hypothetical protein
MLALAAALIVLSWRAWGRDAPAVAGALALLATACLATTALTA